jgi:hypothetical protein
MSNEKWEPSFFVFGQGGLVRFEDISDLRTPLKTYPLGNMIAATIETGTTLHIDLTGKARCSIRMDDAAMLRGWLRKILRAAPKLENPDRAEISATLAARSGFLN